MLEKEVVRVDPRVRRTRQMLQQAMNELMREKDFLDINVQDIAERAGLNRATFYKHFLDKYDLLNAIIRERFQKMLDERLPEKPALTAANLNILIQTVFDYMNGFHGSCVSARVRNEQGMMMQKVQHQIYEILLNWLQHCTVHIKKERSSPEMLALLTSWTIFGPVMQVAWGTSKIQKQALLDQVVAMVYPILEDYLLEPDA